MAESQGLTPRQIEIVKSCVPILAEHGKTITTVFYKNILGENPSLNGTFNHTHQMTGHQAQALACAVFAYAKYIDNLSVLGTAVEHICQKHASLHIQEAHYPVVGGYLLAALKEVLGDAFTDEIRDAWAAAYGQLANIMIGREKQIYSENNGWTEWRDFIVDKKVQESSEITSFYLKPKDGQPLPAFKPGQYLSVQTKVPNFEWLQSRQYSLSGAYNKDYYRISVKKEQGLDINDKSAQKNPGWVSNVLHSEVKEGAILQVSHPAGDFFLDTKANPSSPIVLLSAGVGLTPLISMLDTLVAEKSERKISYIHATRSTETQAFADHVQEAQKNNQNFHAIIFNKSPAQPQSDQVVYNTSVKGRLDLGKVDGEKDLFLGDKTTEYYICGPTSFMSDTVNKLKTLGVEESRIKYEVFGTGSLPQ